MPILLPARPLPNQAVPRPLDYGAWQEPIVGGTINRLDRLGTRMAIDVTTPRMRAEPDGRIWVSRILQAISIDAQMAFPQVGLVIGDPGAPVVNGAGQGGVALAVRGFAAGYGIREGQALNVYDAVSRPYLHFATADVAASSGGTVIVPIWPMLRTAPADGSLCNFLAPVIAGRLTGNEKGWTLARAGFAGLSFTISERR